MSDPLLLRSRDEAEECEELKVSWKTDEVS